MTLLYYFLYSLALIVAVPLAPFIPKLRLGLWGRLFQKKTDTFTSSLWFHVASAGELEQALPILEEIKKKRAVPVVLTFFSPSALRAIEAEKKRRDATSLPWDYVGFAPFDLPFAIKAFSRKINPIAFVAINREIWPGILTYCKKHGIPSFLFSTFLPQQRQKAFEWLLTWGKYFSWIGTVDRQTEEFLRARLPYSHIQRMGDSRIARVIKRKGLQIKPAPWRDFFSKSRPTFIAASLWPEDWENVFPAVTYLQSKGWRIVLVPHELHDSFQRKIMDWGKSQKIPLRLWSQWLRSPDLESSLVVDGVGFLAELYQVAHAVFVGGSFKARIHNILEPVAYGVPVLTGPFVWNSAHALEWKSEGLKMAETSAALKELCQLWDESREKLPQWGASVQKQMLQDEGASLQYAECILRVLDSASKV